MRHTPGPWRYIAADNIIEKVGSAALLVEITPCSTAVGVEERTGNGYLIAAAPDLLEALRALRGDSWRHTVDWGPRDEREAIEARADAAIAKAEGADIPMEGSSQ